MEEPRRRRAAGDAFDVARLNELHAEYHRLLREARDPREWAYAWRSWVNRGGLLAFDLLAEEVVTPGRCVGCAACVTICPVDVFDYEAEQPVATRTDSCVRCVLCADVCPVLRPADADLAGHLGYLDPIHDEGFGPYGYALLTRASRVAVRSAGQDGGTVTTLVTHALETGKIAGAVLGGVSPHDPQRGEARLATTREEVVACAGSRYTYSPNTLALREAMHREVAPLAVVGVPCQVDGVRYQQYPAMDLSTAAWYRDNVRLVIGLFCSEAFTQESTVALEAALGVGPGEVVNINVKGKVLARLRDGTELTYPLADFRAFARPACLYCADYAAAHADVAAGGIGLSGWTYLVVRTAAGAEVVESALEAGLLDYRPVEEEPRATRLLQRLATQKAARPPAPLLPDVPTREAAGDLDPKAFDAR